MGSRGLQLTGTMALAVCLAACGASTSSPPLRTDGTLSVCSYAEFTPISYGNGEGYEADLLRSIARSWDVQAKFAPTEVFDGIWMLPSDPARACDVAIGGITPTDERKGQGAVFSPTTATFSQSLLVRRADFDSGRITDYASFAGSDMVIGVVPGTTGESYAQQRAKEAGLPPTVLQQYPSEAELLTALRNGEIDAIARGEIGNEYQESKDPSVVTIARRSFGEGFAISVDPANAELQTALAQAIARATKDGTVGYREWRADPTVFDRG